MTPRGASRYAQAPHQGARYAERRRASDYGRPQARSPLGEPHPRYRGALLDRIQQRVQRRGPTSNVDGAHVKDSSTAATPRRSRRYDTGYKITFPLFEEDLISLPDKTGRAVPGASFTLKSPKMFFIRAAQPLGAIMPLAEAQAHGRRTTCGDYALDPRGRMRADIRGPIEAMRTRYVASKATPFRSTSTTTAMRLPRSAARAPHGARQRFLPPAHAELLPPQNAS